jgi:hypothetical protein
MDEFSRFVLSQPSNRVSATLTHLQRAQDSAKVHAEPPSTIQAIESAKKLIQRDIALSIKAHSPPIGIAIVAEMRACLGTAADGTIHRLQLDKCVQVAGAMMANGRYAGFLDGQSSGDQ